jgi:hypothetical protein
MIETDMHNSMEFFPNTKYSILSEGGEFKPFRGVIKGKTSKLVKVEGVKMTPNHFVLLKDRWVVARDVASEVMEGEFEVYDLVDVEENHSYMSEGLLHHNCQTGEQLVHVYDTKLDKKLDVSFEELRQMIILDNLGLDYQTAMFFDV